VSTSIGTFIDEVGGGGFGVTRRDRARGNLTMDIGGGRAEMVLVGAERVEHDID